MISILDYKAGNIQSVQRAIARIGGESMLITSADEVLLAEKLILPGVGHFGKAMAYLKESGLSEALNEKVLVQKTPVLGICLGMQLMCAHSEEGAFGSAQPPGLGWFDAKVTRMEVTDFLRYKIPHTGWNGIQFANEHSVLNGLEQGSEFYFVHAYHVADAPEELVLTRTTHEKPFVSGLQKDHIIGVQFHPEKSHGAGEQLIRNFIAL
jgi:imidazole glycerol-phosphate synthase subunit HisH